MTTVSDALAHALQLHRAGRLQAAEQIYRQILAVEPNHVDALHLLGVVAYEAGQHEAAIAYIRQAIGLKGTIAAFHNSLGNAFKAQGKLDEAVASYRRALELKPGYVEAHNNLGNGLRSQGKLEEAIACYRRALELKPGYAEAQNNLGNVFRDQRKLDEAAACYRRALELRPGFAEAHNNLGTVLKDQGTPDEAIACYRRAIELKPGYAETHYNLGNVFKEQGKYDDAVASYRRALELNPKYADAHNNLGAAFKEQGKLDEAIACYFRALELRPEHAQAHNNLGAAFKDQGKFAQAVDRFLRALELRPGFPEAHNNLGSAFKDQGKLRESVACYRRALELKPNYAAAHSNLLFTLQYDSGESLSELAAAHAEFDRLHAESLRAARRPYKNVRDPYRRLRVGFVSPDFGRHPVGYFLIRALENLNRDQWETVCYCDRIVKDDLTRRLQAATTLWRDVSGLIDGKLAEMIYADGIDILFDLAGHTARNRLLVFARKPSPIQVTWAGYVGTTGLKAMDYILADRYEIPREAEVYYCEKVLRMPDGYVCYDPPDYAPPVSPLPALKQGCVTFGSFNNPAKIGPQVIDLWAKILQSTPRSRLLVKYMGMDEVSVAKRIREGLEGQAVDPSRVEYLGRSPHRELLGEYHRVDVGLDPFPYNGGLTTCEALWMGVPVVTCPGATFASRHSLSHLSSVGFRETIAGDFEEYVELAVSLAADLPRLAALRTGLRQRMNASPLCDGRRFAANLAILLRDIWRQWIVQDSSRL